MRECGRWLKDLKRIVKINNPEPYKLQYLAQAVHTGSGWEAYWELCQGEIGVQVALLGINSRGV